MGWSRRTCHDAAWRRTVCIVLALLIAFACRFVAAGESGIGGMGGGMGDFLGEGIDFKGGMLDWEEDENGNRVAILRNYAVVILPMVTISARNMVLNVEMQELYAEGDVLFEEKSGNSFHCDQLTFNYAEWNGLAKNIQVKMNRADVTLPVRDFLDDPASLAFNTGSGMSSFGETGSLNNYRQSGAALKRMYVQASELRAHDRETFELIDTKITPDSFARPHWYFHSPAALLRRNEKIESYHNTVRIGKVPVLYFPYLIRDLQYDWPWMSITGGYTADYGAFVRTQWGWRLKERPNAFIRSDKIIFDVDLFSRRGAGFGVETTYKTGPMDSYGKLKLYGVYEFLTSDSKDMDRAYNKNADRIYQGYPNWGPSLYGGDFRWAVDWEHYQQLNEFWDVRAELHLYHDRDYLREYDPNLYWSGKPTENSIDIRRMNKLWELEFVASSRLSDKWLTGPEYYPEARLTLPGMQLGNTPFFLKDDLRVGVVNKRFDEDQYKYTKNNAGGLFALDDTGLSTSRLYDPDNYGSFFRAFNELRLEAPLKLMDVATLKPWVGLRTAYYGDTLGTPYSQAEIMSWNTPGGPKYNDYLAYNQGYFTPGQLREDGKGETYYAVPFGADLSSRFYTFMGSNEQWRLTSEPVFSYLENAHPKLDYKRDLFPIDEWDEYYRQRRFGMEYHAKLQRRYYERAPGDKVPERDVLDFNIGFFYYPRETDQNNLNHGESLSEIRLDTIYRPIERLSLSATADYDPGDNAFNRAILSADWRLSNLVRMSLSHYYYRGHYWRYPNDYPSSQTYFAIRTKLWNDSSHYSLETAVGYEWKDSYEWETSRTGVRHGFNRYRVTLFRDIDTFEFALSYAYNRNEDNHGVYFSLTPKSFFGFDRPPPTYSAAVEALDEGRYPDSIRYLGNGYLIDDPVYDADIKDVQF